MIIAWILKIVLFLVEILFGFLPSIDFDFDAVSIGFLLNDEFQVPYLLSLMSLVTVAELGYLTYRVVKFIVTLLRGGGS
jgi:hypothetical protein|nr:MAG TPA: hypothetical protein [Inoviridae sp.]